MTRLLHMSDPHFGTVQAPVEEALVRLSAAQKPSVLVLSGDITQRAHDLQFSDARAFCDRLAVPHLLAVPGNHDIALFDLWRRLRRPYAAYLKHFGPDLESVVDTDEFLVIGVNTTRWWRHKNGDVSPAQIERVVARLAQAQAAAPHQLRAVVVHQPVHVLRPEDEHDRLRNWAPAVRAWSAAGADVILGGHIHLPYVAELTDALPLASASHRTWCVQAGTSLSHRVRQEAPNSVNIVWSDRRHGGRVGVVERWDFVSAVVGGPGEFECVRVTELALTP